MNRIVFIRGRRRLARWTLCLIFATAAAFAQPFDTDGDGVIDVGDNCVLHPNGPLLGPNDQLDSDHDGYGN
ncbi:MAG: hypothetical protein AAEJ53_15360, partial [Myxococcota bacterium]